MKALMIGFYITLLVTLVAGFGCGAFTKKENCKKLLDLEKKDPNWNLVFPGEIMACEIREKL